ncbi:hypothetical protein GSI_02015 [Ganoderma sinense ZZ0214-1]|uniref:Uncharacterized protein n=1 Tax=Ganoderma sinense ZZ0214-1 TaxID=1077348 RepID=A0A2G8SNF8_9APHY|nr:hypothetical protein GSI_02015 [Ganoderma sinense ZZ0214-1]
MVAKGKLFSDLAHLAHLPATASQVPATSRFSPSSASRVSPIPYTIAQLKFPSPSLLRPRSPSLMTLRHLPRSTLHCAQGAQLPRADLLRDQASGLHYALAWLVQVLPRPPLTLRPLSSLYAHVAAGSSRKHFGILRSIPSSC